MKNDRGWRRVTHKERWEATFSDTSRKVKIIIPLPEKLEVWRRGRVVTREFDESAYDRAYLEFWTSGRSTGAYSLSVELNGREIKRYSRGIRGNARWHSVLLESPARETIRDAGEAEVIFSLSGAPHPETDYVTFYGDAAITSGNSFLFDGVDWTQDDLSEWPDDQQGEFYVRLAYKKGLFTEPSLTSERVVIPLLCLVAVFLLMLFRRSINQFRISTTFSAWKSTFRAHRELVVFLVMVFVLALVLRSYLVIRYPRSKLDEDAVLYDTIARNAVSGYGLAANPPEVYPLFFGYTLFLTGVYSVLGRDLQAVYLSQAVIGSLTCVLVFLIAYRLFDKGKCSSLVAALLACCFPPFIEYTGRLLTETLATFALALFVYLFTVAAKATRSRLFILSGLAFGLAVISRDIFFYLLVLILAIIVVASWRNKGQVIRFMIFFLLGAVLICSPLLVRNAFVFSPDRAFFGTMVRRSPSYVLTTIKAQDTAPAESTIEIVEDNPEEWQEASQTGVGEALPPEVSNVKGLVHDWIGYLRRHIERWMSIIEFVWYPGSWRSTPIFDISLRHLLTFRRLIVFLAFLGAITSLSQWKEHLLLYSLIVYASTVHAIMGGYPRYSIVWMPYVCIFAAAGIGALVIVVQRTRSKSLALALIALIAFIVSAIVAEEQFFWDLLGPLTDEGLLVIELCLVVLICFLLLKYRRKIPNAMICMGAVLAAFGYMVLRGQAMPLPPEETFSILMDANHYVGHLIDLPQWTQGYDSYYLKMKIDGAQIEPPQKKYGVRVFANGEMIKEYSISSEAIHGWERIPVDKQFIEGQKKLYVSLQVFGAPNVFENYLGVYIRRDRGYGLSVFNDSTHYLSIDRDEKQRGTFLIGLEMMGKGVYQDVDLWLGSRFDQAEKLALLGDESGNWYNLGEEIALVGYDVGDAVKAGEVLRPRLYWQARAKINEDYTVFVHLLDGEGNILAQQDGQPQGGDYPTFLWRRGEVVWDAHELHLPPDLADGCYQLVAGMYLLETMERLPVLDARGERQPYDMILLGEVKSE